MRHCKPHTSPSFPKDGNSKNGRITIMLLPHIYVMDNADRVSNTNQDAPSFEDYVDSQRWMGRNNLNSITSWTITRQGWARSLVVEAINLWCFERTSNACGLCYNYSFGWSCSIHRPKSQVVCKATNEEIKDCDTSWVLPKEAIKDDLLSAS